MGVVGLHHVRRDNHGDFDLTTEASSTLRMLESIDIYWKTVKDLGIADQTIYATLSVFGRDAKRGAKGGRGHGGDFCSGLVLGDGIQGGVIGGLDTSGSHAKAAGINTTDGSASNPDVAPEDTLDTYYKTLMRLVGVPSDRREVRLPEARELLSLG
ncbi:MAG: DUF1501 domain-containing protein [Myxococcota bacterium]